MVLRFLQMALGAVQVLLRILRPPYCYRWAALITASVVLVTFVRVAQSALAGPQHRPTAAAVPSASPTSPIAVSAELMHHTGRTGLVVALTFDDGPDPEYTPQILTLLNHFGAVGTFCMVGSTAARHPEIVQQVVSAGMHLCHHSLTHDYDLSELTEPEIEAEIVQGKAQLLAAAGQPVPVNYFRAPGGRWSDSVRQMSARHGMTPLSWSVDPRDWDRPGVDAIVARVKQEVHPGAIILLHDGGGRRDQTVEALSQLLPWLIEQGYGFVAP